MVKKIYKHLTGQVAQEWEKGAQGKKREESPNLEKMKRVSKFLEPQIKPK